MALDSLDVLIPDLSLNYSSSDIQQLYDKFKSVILNANLSFKGLPLTFKMFLSSVSDFTQYPEAFVHLITRKGNIGKKRYFEVERANRLHWIKEVIEEYNIGNKETKYFTHNEFDETIRDYLWYDEGNYVVVLEINKNGYLLITGHCVDDRNKLQKRYEKFLNSGI